MSNPGHVVETLLAERERRWRSGQPVTSEEFLEAFIPVRDDSEAAVSVIYQEYCLRREEGEKPSPGEFITRFPQYAERLLLQFQLHSAISKLALTVTQSRQAPLRSLPFRVGRYELRKSLGRGGSSSVYKAADRRRGTKVVIRIFDLDEADRLVFVQALRTRIRRLSEIRHGGLQRIHGLGVCKGHPYVVMDYIRGVSLAEWFKRRRSFKSIRRAVSLVCGAAKALTALHDAGLVHGSVTLEHFLLTEACEPILTAPRLTDLDQVSPAEDVHALGLILHRMLTGQLPDADPPMIHRPEIDPMLDAIVRQAVAPAAELRFANGRILTEALGAWLKRNAFR